jgi:PAS domain S-box-containing protein
VDVFSSKIKAKGKDILHSIIHDITERKRAEEALRESEERMKSIFRAAPTGIGVLTDRTFMDVNLRMCEMTGYTKEELIGASARVLYPTQDDFDYVGTEKYRQIAQKGTGSVETRWKKTDGTIIDVLLSSTPIDTSDLSRGVTFTALDITERKQTEDALRQSEEKYRTILENMQEGYFEFDLVGNYTFANDAECRNIGYPKEELIGMNNRQYQDETNARKMYQFFRRLFRTGEQVKAVDVEIIRKNGTKGFNEVSASLIRDAEGKPIGFRGISRDITERKQAEETLKESEEKFRLLFELSADGYLILDNGHYIDCNEAALRIAGFTVKEQLIGLRPIDISPEYQPDGESSAAKAERMIALAYEKGSHYFEWVRKRFDGSELALEVMLTAIPMKGRRLLHTTWRDISERKRAEKELLKSEEKYRRLVENAQEGIFQSTAEGHHITVNQAFANILGYESPEEVLATIADIPHQVYVHPDDRTKILQIIEKEGSVKSYEAEFYKKDGSKTWVSINMHAVRDEEGRLLYYQGIDQNITEKKKIKAERQENIERLRKSLEAMINAMAVTVETRDPYTAGHQRRVADLARAIAVEMNLKSEQIDSIRMASMIHDIGKIAVPAEILSKPTKLTDLEFDLIKTHSQSGYDILKDIEFPWPLADFVLQHHERMNGSGYPQGLKGDDILLEARIMAVADVVEAIASYRPYRPALGIDLALEEISGNKGILYDADAVDACLKLFREKGYTLVR